MALYTAPHATLLCWYTHSLFADERGNFAKKFSLRLSGCMRLRDITGKGQDGRESGIITAMCNRYYSVDITPVMHVIFHSVAISTPTPSGDCDITPGVIQRTPPAAQVDFPSR